MEVSGLSPFILMIASSVTEHLLHANMHSFKGNFKEQYLRIGRFGQ